jgi:uncharacterized UPF0160 family protein
MTHNKAVVVTHDGRFHADEVFAIVLLELGMDEVMVHRTRDEETIKSAQNNQMVFVLDVGKQHNEDMRNFDHHQLEDKSIATFGLVYEYCIKNGFADMFENPKAAPIFRKMIVDKIDAYDNNYQDIIHKARDLNVLTLQDVFGFINWPDPDDREQQEHSFRNAVQLAKYIVQYAMEHADLLASAEDRYNKADKFEGVLVAPKFLRGWAKYAKPDRVFTHLFRQGDVWKVVTIDDKSFPLFPRAGDDTPDTYIGDYLAIFNDYNRALRYAKRVSANYRDVVPDAKVKEITDKF